MLGFNFALQVIIISLLALSLIMSAIFEESFLIFSGILHFVLGVEQVLGGLILGFYYKSKLHAKYSIGAIAYVIVLITLGALDFINNEIVGVLVIGIIPWIIALWYSYIAYKFHKGSLTLEHKKQHYADEDFILDDLTQLRP